MKLPKESQPKLKTIYLLPNSTYDIFNYICVKKYAEYCGTR